MKNQIRLDALTQSTGLGNKSNPRKLTDSQEDEKT
jgi:hypothetical protein